MTDYTADKEARTVVIFKTHDRKVKMKKTDADDVIMELREKLIDLTDQGDVHHAVSGLNANYDGVGDINAGCRAANHVDFIKDIILAIRMKTGGATERFRAWAQDEEPEGHLILVRITGKIRTEGTP